MRYSLVGLLFLACQFSQGGLPVECLEGKIKDFTYDRNKQMIPVFHTYHGGVWNAAVYDSATMLTDELGEEVKRSIIGEMVCKPMELLSGKLTASSNLLEKLPIPEGTNIFYTFAVQWNDCTKDIHMLFRPQWGFFNEWLEADKSHYVNIAHKSPSVMRICLGGNDWLDVDFIKQPEVSFHSFRDDSDYNRQDRCNSPNSHHLPNEVQDGSISYAAMHCTYYPDLKKAIYGTTIVLSQEEFNKFRKSKDEGRTLKDGLLETPLVRDSKVLQQVLGLID